MHHMRFLFRENQNNAGSFSALNGLSTLGLCLLLPKFVATLGMSR